MKTVAVIFVLALITIAGELYLDALLTSGLITPAAPDPAAVAVAHAAKHG
jgi:hypothetical protein